MARVQTRRTISVSASMMEATRSAASRAGVPIAQYVHEAIAARMRGEGRDPPRHNPTGLEAAQRAVGAWKDVACPRGRGRAAASGPRAAGDVEQAIAHLRQAVSLVERIRRQAQPRQRRAR